METKDELISHLEDAMDRSRSQDRIINMTVDASIRTAIDVLERIYDGHIDGGEELDGSYDVWGWKADAAEDEAPEWRLNIAKKMA